MLVTPERNVEEIIAGWRQGLDLDGLENPAGPLYAGGEFAEHEISLVGTRNTGSTICGTWCTVVKEPYACC